MGILDNLFLNLGELDQSGSQQRVNPKHAVPVEAEGLTISVDEKWLERFVRAIVIKTLAEVHGEEKENK